MGRRCIALAIRVRHSGMRVRFEIRELPPGQWDKIVRALWIMKMTKIAEGKRLYGSAFVSYDYMVAKHIKAALNSEGDQSTLYLCFLVVS